MIGDESCDRFGMAYVDRTSSIMPLGDVEVGGWEAVRLGRCYIRTSNHAGCRQFRLEMA